MLLGGDLIPFSERHIKCFSPHFIEFTVIGQPEISLNRQGQHHPDCRSLHAPYQEARAGESQKDRRSCDCIDKFRMAHVVNRKTVALHHHGCSSYADSHRNDSAVAELPGRLQASSTSGCQAGNACKAQRALEPREFGLGPQGRSKVNYPSRPVLDSRPAENRSKFRISFDKFMLDQPRLMHHVACVNASDLARSQRRPEYMSRPDDRRFEVATLRRLDDSGRLEFLRQTGSP